MPRLDYWKRILGPKQKKSPLIPHSHRALPHTCHPLLLFVLWKYKVWFFSWKKKKEKIYNI
jgi:hypothetical protein